VHAGKGHEIMGNVHGIEHFENLGRASVSSLWSDLTSQTAVEAEHHLTVFQRIESIRDDLESVGQTVEESVTTSAVETTFISCVWTQTLRKFDRDLFGRWDYV
jgi:hypothetical protein